jgi:hypothetical protein
MNGSDQLAIEPVPLSLPRLYWISVAQRLAMRRRSCQRITGAPGNAAA